MKSPEEAVKKRGTRQLPGWWQGQALESELGEAGSTSRRGHETRWFGTSTVGSKNCRGQQRTSHPRQQSGSNDLFSTRFLLFPWGVIPGGNQLALKLLSLLLFINTNVCFISKNGCLLQRHLTFFLFFSFRLEACL